MNGFDIVLILYTEGYFTGFEDIRGFSQTISIDKILSMLDWPLNSKDNALTAYLLSHNVEISGPH